MPNGKRDDDLLDKYKRKIESEMGGEPKPTTGVVSREYSQFKKELLPTQFGWYEKACNFSESILKISPKKKDIPDLEESIDVCHLNITPTGVASFSILGPLAFTVFGSLISFILLQDMFFVVFFLFFGLAIMNALKKLPDFLANSWRMKASNQMVLCVFYTVTYMRHTSNLENAIDFASGNLSPPLSLDMKKILWDVETQKYENIRDSLDHYLDTWKKWNMEFIEAMHLIESSLYEGDDARRLNTLDKSLSVILEGTYEKMLHYSHNLKGPITMLHMMGVILPILGLVILPLVVSFTEGVAWYHIGLMYNVALPIGVLYIGTKILAQRPTGYGDTDVAEEHPELKKERNIKLNLGFYKTRVNPLMLSLLVGGLLFMIGISPLMLHILNPSMDFDFCIQEGEFKTGVQLEEGEVKGLCLLDYKENEAGQVIGPFGVGSALLGIFIPLSVGLGISLYFHYRSKNVMKIRNKSKKLEEEFASALFQLGGRLGDGIPTEMAFSKVADSMKGTTSGEFFSTVDGNIKRLGMGVESAIFDPKYGALKKFPSKLIGSSMKVLIESSRKGPQIAAEALTNVSRYLKELHRVDERLRDLMGDIVGSMKSQVKFLSPVISGIVVGITSMISSILGRLQGHLGSMAAESGAGGAMGGGITNMFGVGIPTYFFQIVVGLYVVELGVILIILSNGIENGADKLMRNYRLGTDLRRGVILYCSMALIIIFLFNMIADTIMGGTL